MTADTHPAHVMEAGGPDHYAAGQAQALHYAILSADWDAVRKIAADPYTAGDDVDLAKGALAGALQPLTSPQADPMHIAAEAAVEAVIARLQPSATKPHGELGIGPKRAAVMAVDAAAPIIRDAARAQAFREAAEMVANAKPESTNPGFQRAMEAFQAAIATGLRIAANLTKTDQP